MNKKIMEACGFGEEVNKIEAGVCPICGNNPLVTGFRDELSKREFEISGLCQTCQDETFGK
jgi:hypothetical protein